VKAPLVGRGGECSEVAGHVPVRVFWLAILFTSPTENVSSRI
jgi:hypothetical protein